MKLFSSTDLAIAKAIRSNTLRVEIRIGRFGEFIAVSDETGLIEVHNSKAEADKRLAEIKAALR